MCRSYQWSVSFKWYTFTQSGPKTAMSVCWFSKSLISASCYVLFDFPVPCSGTGAHFCGECHFLEWCGGLMVLLLLEVNDGRVTQEF